MREQDVRVSGISLYTFPLKTRIPLAFGRERATGISVLRAAVTVTGASGKRATGYADVPLNVQWAWPSKIPPAERLETLLGCAVELADRWAEMDVSGHPMELYHAFKTEGGVASCPSRSVLPSRAWQLLLSVFDLATHDGYGAVHGVPTYETYTPRYMSRDLGALLNGSSYAGDLALRFPRDYLVSEPQPRILAWHMVGKEDYLTEGEVPASAPGDGYPLSLESWIARDGLQALKIKLGAESLEENVRRFLEVWKLARNASVRLTSIDFNGTLPDLAALKEFLSRLRERSPEGYKSICYIEEPCAIGASTIEDITELNDGVPLLVLDESVASVAELEEAIGEGWRGIALKTCKGQSETLLMLALAKELGLRFTVQDLTNPMLAQLTHLLLGSRSGAALGVESNCMQFYPGASDREAAVHRGAFTRRNGELRLDSIDGPGFGYRLDEIGRPLPEPIYWREGAASGRGGSVGRRRVGGRDFR
ncbi:MAG: enolase C-terminal domain-like protein [Alkalispirochaetaceae bacterium]